MKKILITFCELFYGGAEKQFRELISRIDKTRFEIVAVVSCAYLGDNQPEAVKEFVKSHSDIKFYFLKGVVLPKNIAKKIKISFCYKKQLKEIINKEKPDITLIYSGMELSAAKICKHGGSKVIFSERESGNRGTLKLFRYKYLFRSVDKIVCNSLEAKRFYESKHIKAGYIPNGIQKHEILETKKADDVFSILVPARIARVKNQELVINAVAHLTYLNYKVTFIGNQEDPEYLSYLKNLITEKKINDKIEFLKFTDHIEQLYQKTDLIILPSLMEGFTNVLLESYMFGRICLVSNIVMNKDVASPTQRFFSTDDDLELSKQIMIVENLSQKDKEQEINVNHNHAVDHFSIELMVDSYCRLFDSI